MTTFPQTPKAAFAKTYPTRMRFATLVACSLLLGALPEDLTAQPMGKSRPEDILRVAEEELAADRPYSALKLFKEYYDENKDRDIAYRIGMLNYELRDYTNAKNYLQRSQRRAAEGENVDALFYLGRSLKAMGLYGEAIESFKEFKLMASGNPLRDFADLEIAGAQMALKMTEPPRIKVTNAGRSVNTSNQEYSPVLTAGGDLYYAGFGKSGVVAESGEDHHDIRIFSAPAQDEGYGRGKPLPKNINRSGFQTVNVAVSPDGERMLLIRSEIDGRKLETSELYLSEKSGSGWGPANAVGGVNGDYRVKHPAFGELFGESVIYFASDMPGGRGGYDLYYAKSDGAGGYKRPVNLGEAINTAYDDVTPFYRDGTLYFSTEGRPTLGGFDVFRTEWSGDAWSEPVNMGKGFNSSYDDRYFQLDGTGKRGVLTSNRPPTRSVKSKTCCDDVFLLNVEPIIIELLALTLDNEGGLLPGVTVDLLEIADGDTTYLSRKRNPKGNRFDFSLVDGVSYTLLATLDGYEPASAELNTVGIDEPTTLQRTLVLTPEPAAEPPKPADDVIELTLNQPIRLANIYYDYDDDKILPAAEPDLDYIRGIMEDYPEMVVELGSHTDARGRDAYNMDLSQRRAQSAVDYLVDNGIDRGRLRAQGYGETVILNECENGVKCSDDAHRFNRRTEFKIIEGPTTIEVKRQRKVVGE